MVSDILPGVNMESKKIETIGDRLRAARKHKGYTIEQLRSIIGISKPTLIRYEKSERSPSLDLVIKISDATGVPQEWIASGTYYAGPFPSSEKENDLDKLPNLSPTDMADIGKQIDELNRNVQLLKKTMEKAIGKENKIPRKKK